MMIMITLSVFLVLTSILTMYNVNCEPLECFKLKTSITQMVEYEGFHRNIWWILEVSEPSQEAWVKSKCKLLLRLDIGSSMFVNPDEMAELNRTGELHSQIYGKIDVEAPAHEATGHTVYVFIKAALIHTLPILLPIHLRYQRSQIEGGYGKAILRRPSLLMKCPDNLNVVCSNNSINTYKIEAPCDEKSCVVCNWENVSYVPQFEDLELFVPVGDLNHHTLVSVVTLLVGCSGCLYILSL